MPRAFKDFKETGFYLMSASNVPLPESLDSSIEKHLYLYHVGLEHIKKDNTYEFTGAYGPYGGPYDAFLRYMNYFLILK